MSSQIEELFVALGLDATKFEKGMEQQAEKGKEFFAGLKEHALEFFGIMGSVGAFAAFTEHMITSQVAIGRLSKETGAAAEDLQAFGMASEKLGGSLEGANSAIETLGTKLAAVNKGKEFPRAAMAARMFGMAMGAVGKDAEGVGFKIFKGKGPIEALDMLADKLQEKHATFFEAKATLGRLGMGDAQIRMLIQGKDKMHELMEENKKYAASAEDVARSQEIEEVMKNLKFSIAKVTETIAQWALPVLKALGEHFLQISDWAMNHGDTVKKVLIAVGVAAGWMALATVHATVLAMAHWLAHSTLAMVESGKIVLSFFGVKFAAHETGEVEAVAHGKAVLGWVTHGAQAVGGALKVVVGWIASGAAATLAGIQMAAAWIMGLGPIAWIIAGIAAVVAIFVALEMKFHIFEAAWGWIKTAAADALGWMENKIKALGHFITTYLITPFKIVGNLLKGNFKGAISAGADLVKSAGNVIGMDSGAGLPAYAGASASGASVPISHAVSGASVPISHVVAHHHAAAAVAVHPSVVTNAQSSSSKHQSVDNSVKVDTVHINVTSADEERWQKRFGTSLKDDLKGAVNQSEGGMG